MEHKSKTKVTGLFSVKRWCKCSPCCCGRTHCTFNVVARLETRSTHGQQAVTAAGVDEVNGSLKQLKTLH